jgi:hypothetical protein
MASGNLSFETPEFTYNAGGTTYTLRQPLSAVRGGLQQPGQFSSISLDGSNYEVLTVTGSAVHLARALIRYEDVPNDLISFIEAGQSGDTLNYYPDTTGLPATFVSCNLVTPAPGQDWLMALERKGPHAPRDKVLDCVFRRTDGSAFPAWMFNY